MESDTPQTTPSKFLTETGPAGQSMVHTFARAPNDYLKLDPFQNVIGVNWPSGRLPHGFPFTVTVDVWWGFPPADGWTGGGALDGGATYQFALALYGVGAQTPFIDGDGNLNQGSPLHIVRGPTFIEATQNFSAPPVESTNGWMAPGSTSFTLTGHAGGATSSFQSPGDSTAVFLLCFNTNGGNVNAFAAWAQYTATATNIPPQTQMTYPGAQSGTYAPPSITIGSPTPPAKQNTELANSYTPPFSDPGDISGAVNSSLVIDVDFLGIAPDDRMNQSI